MSSGEIIIVSGLPRSGTSMMMQMLEAGGVEILCDGERRADDDNPKGYYELEAVKQTKDDASWLEGAPGKAVKMISQLLLDLPDDRVYRVIFMRREMSEILASQRKMLERRGGGASEQFNDEEMSKIFTQHLAQVTDWLGDHSNMSVHEVWHAEAIRDAAGTAQRVAEFLGRALDVPAMAAAVDGQLHRNRAQVAVSADVAG